MNDLDTVAEPPAATDRRLLKRQYREAGPAMGVYVIRNLATGRLRVRSSLNLEGSMRRDLFELGLKAHRDKELLGEWLRWGAEHFRFDVLDTLKKRDDPAFDHRAELDSLRLLWTEEMRAGEPAVPAPPGPRSPPQPSPADGPEEEAPCRPC